MSIRWITGIFLSPSSHAFARNAEDRTIEQLPAADAVFLAMETPQAPWHVGGLTVLDPTACPDFGFERLRDTVAERIRLAPRFTRKLRSVPLGLDRPYLVDDPDFDVARHLHRVAVPSPGGMRELADLAAYLFSRPLDRGRPLWELWWIEGVENGRCGMLMKSHHCLMDGVSGTGLGELLCDLDPDPARGPALAPDVAGADSGAGRAPSDLEVGLRAAASLAGSPGRLARFGGRMLRQTLGQALARGRPGAPPLPFEIPTTEFNAPVGARRAFACASVPLDAVKAVKQRFGVTVNDVLLAITGAAVRGYLLARGGLPDESLVAMIAVSTRSEDDRSVGNQVTAVPVVWATDEPDPVRRLEALHANARVSKSLARDWDARMMEGLGEALPPGLLQVFMQAAGGRAAALFNPGNAVVSTVRGTPVPLYVAGARIECMYPLSVLAPGHGLNVTVITYCGRADVGFVVDPALVPDPWSLAEGIAPALDELLAAGDGGAGGRQAGGTSRAA